MRTIFLPALVLSISAIGAQAQVLSANFKPLPMQTERMEFESTLIEPRQPEANRVLPDAPIAKVPASVCPAGVGKPCAFLAGRPYIPDQFHFMGHNLSWVKAVSNPAIVVVSSLQVASFIMDYKTTRYCIDRHLAREANPLLGQSRAQELGVGIGLNLVSFWAAGKLKARGDGNLVFLGEWAMTMMHSYAAIRNATTCGY
jgi:hypothetical protein